MHPLSRYIRPPYITHPLAHVNATAATANVAGIHPITIARRRRHRRFNSTATHTKLTSSATPSTTTSTTRTNTTTAATISSTYGSQKQPDHNDNDEPSSSSSSSSHAPNKAQDISGGVLPQWTQYEQYHNRQQEQIVDFHDVEQMYRTKPTYELLRSYFVLQSCQLGPIATIGAPLLEHGGPLVRFAAKYTYFRYFCAGEGLNDPRLAQMVSDISTRDGMQATLDYSVEGADTPEGADAIAEVIAESIRFARMQNDQAAAMAAMHNSSIGKEYAGEMQNKHRYRNKCSSGVVKLTGVSDMMLLEKISKIICYEQMQYMQQVHSEKRPVDPQSYKSMLPESLQLHNYHLSHGGQRTPAFAFSRKPEQLSEEDVKQLDRVLSRIALLCETSVESRVPLLIDAEQSYVQPAIDQIAMTMCLRYNDHHDGSGRPILYNTYQMYLKDALYRLQHDTLFAKKHGVRLGAKLVRGAYMKTESARSENYGIPNPVNSSLEATHESFHAGVHHCLSNIDTMGVIIASHNQNSIYNAAHWVVHQYGLERDDERVQFAQLHGMGDYLSLALVRAGFNVAKYMPFGPVVSVLPYLSRRLTENGDMLGGAAMDVRKMRKEIYRRTKAAFKKF